MAVEIDAGRLMAMNQAELDHLFMTSRAGPTPAGEGRGTVLFNPGGPLEDVAAKLAHHLFWQGKVFDPARGELRNEILPVSLRAIVAKVYRGPSWVDGEECIVLDYSETSLIAQRIRDEIREVAPGLYLGVVFWDRLKILNFSLNFQ
jgi:hypothetical protein